jgi:hypothetical protein
MRRIDISDSSDNSGKSANSRHRSADQKKTSQQQQ